MRRIGIYSGLVAVSLLAIGCGSSEVDPTKAQVAAPSTTEAAESAASSTTTETVATTTTEPVTTTTKAPKLTVTATDYTYSGLPEAVGAGVELQFVNDSPNEFHELVIFKLADDETRTVDELQSLPFEELDSYAVGSVQSVVLAMPESEQYTYLLGPPKLNDEGRYLVFCAIPVGMDPIEARSLVANGPVEDTNGQPRHYEVGMIQEVIVIAP